MPMNITESKLRQIIKEELKKGNLDPNLEEGVMDYLKGFFRKKKKAKDIMKQPKIYDESEYGKFKKNVLALFRHFDGKMPPKPPRFNEDDPDLGNPAVRDYLTKRNLIALTDRFEWLLQSAEKKIGPLEKDSFRRRLELVLRDLKKIQSDGFIKARTSDGSTRRLNASGGDAGMRLGDMMQRVQSAKDAGKAPEPVKFGPTGGVFNREQAAAMHQNLTRKMGQEEIEYNQAIDKPTQIITRPLYQAQNRIPENKIKLKKSKLIRLIKEEIEKQLMEEDDPGSGYAVGKCMHDFFEKAVSMKKGLFSDHYYKTLEEVPACSNEKTMKEANQNILHWIIVKYMPEETEHDVQSYTDEQKAAVGDRMMEKIGGKTLAGVVAKIEPEIILQGRENQTAENPYFSYLKLKAQNTNTQILKKPGYFEK